MKPENSYFKTRFREVMKLSGLTISQFAEHVGVSSSTVMNWRTGLIPNALHLRKIAHIGQCSMDSFFETDSLRVPDEKAKSDSALKLARQLVCVLTQLKSERKKILP